MKKVIIVFIVLSVFILTIAVGQPIPDDPSGDPDVPITGGLGYLLAAGLGYGVYALKKRKKS